ncbi:MAG: HIT family protein [Bacteroidota bacterium]
MSSIFTKIISGEIPCYKVAEDDKFLAFLDINPLAKGHTLVIPKTEVDDIFQLDPETYAALFLFAQRIAKAMKPHFDCKKIGIAVIGLEVPHAHIHLVPINGVYDIDFKKPKLSLTPEEFLNIANTIKSSL